MKMSGCVRFVAVLLALLLLAGPGSSLAQDEITLEDTAQVDAEGPARDVNEYVRSGPYLQAGFVQAFGDFKDLDTDPGYGLDLTVGARINRYLAAEVGYEGIFNWNIRGEDASTYALMASVKGYFPLGGLGPIRSIQPFALAGLGTVIALTGNEHVARFTYRFGGGVDVFLTESLYLSLTARYTGNLDNFGYTNLVYGIGYHFD